MNKFKAAIISFFTAIGNTTKADELRASKEDSVNLTAEDVEGFTADVESFKQKAEENATAAADLLKAQEELATANATIATLTTAKETAEASLATATTELETANARVAELETEDGNPTGAGKKEMESAEGVPSWVDPNADHYKALEDAGISVFK